eukprot:419426_1
MLRNVVGIVSGGASGLGAASVAHIIRHGGRAIVADLPHQKDTYLRLAAECTAEAALRSHSDRDDKGNKPVIAFSPVNVTDENQISAALDLAEQEFGQPISACINCAGVASAKRLLFKDKNIRDGNKVRVMPLEDFTKVLEVNALGSFNVARLAAQRMVERKPDADGLRGCIINTSSIAAFEGQTGQVAYSASKGAIVGMTLPLARDLANYGIRVMTIAPGVFATPLLDDLPDSVQGKLGKMVPCPNRLGSPDEYGKLVISILTNPMLNGEIIRLDGALRLPA